VLAGTVMACTSAPPAADPQTLATPVAKWERPAGTAFENRGVAKVERLGTRWVLSVMCDGTHATYLDDTTLDLGSYAKSYVTARYTWVTRETDVKCPMAPCPRLKERRIALERLTVVNITDAAARDLAQSCK
jgi:hypothetical protein